MTNNKPMLGVNNADMVLVKKAPVNIDADLVNKLEWVRLFYGFKGKFAHRVMKKTPNGLIFTFKGASTLMVLDYLSHHGIDLSRENIVKHSYSLTYSLQYFLTIGYMPIILSVKQSRSMRLEPNEITAFEIITDLQILASMMAEGSQMESEIVCEVI